MALTTDEMIAALARDFKKRTGISVEVYAQKDAAERSRTAQMHAASQAIRAYLMHLTTMVDDGAATLAEFIKFREDFTTHLQELLKDHRKD